MRILIYGYQHNILIDNMNVSLDTNELQGHNHTEDSANVTQSMANLDMSRGKSLFSEENKKKIQISLLKNSIIMKAYDVTIEVSRVFM